MTKHLIRLVLIAVILLVLWVWWRGVPEESGEPQTVEVQTFEQTE